MIKIRKFSRNVDNLDNILSIVNEAYKIEIGQEGVAFKKFDRLGSTEEILTDQLHVALIGYQIVGVININTKHNIAELGHLLIVFLFSREATLELALLVTLYHRALLAF